MKQVKPDPRDNDIKGPAKPGIYGLIKHAPAHPSPCVCISSTSTKSGAYERNAQLIYA